MSRRRVIFDSKRSQQGVTLLEVLISVLILGIGMLGIAAMQTTALRNSQSSFERSQAVIHSYAIIDAMRANRAAALGGGYNVGMTCEAPDAGTLAQNDLREWVVSMQAGMGGGDTTCDSVNCDAGVCTVVVRWDDSRAADGAAQGDAEYEVTTVVNI